MTQKKSGMIGIFMAALMIAKKWGVLAKAVKAIKLLKVAKPLVMMLSIMVSVLAYGWVYGSWWFALGLVAMMFIHEMGHVIALRKEGMPPSPMVFIPFLGAAIFVPEMKTRVTEARIGIGGPVLGTIGALAAFAAWALIPGEHSILLLISYIGIVLNLFNMIPISPLDGGRITQLCGPWFKYVGLAMVIALIGFTRQPSIILILILVLDGFKRMPYLWRPVISAVLLIMMIMLFLTGYSDQHWIIDAVDVVFALMFTLIYLVNDLKEEKELTAYEDEAQITPALRTKWLIYWVSLVAVLVGTLAVQIPLMPKKVLERATIMAQ